MENQPHNPGDRDRDIPERERLWPGEIDLTGSVTQPGALRDVIGDAIAEADGIGDKIPDWGARVIARELANRCQEPINALHHYAVTGTVDHGALARELAAQADSEDEESRELADLLGLYLIKQPAGRPHGSDIAPLTETTVERGLREHGALFWAYLQLPDTEARAENTIERFKDFHLGSYATMSDIIDTLTEFPNFLKAVKDAEEEWGFDQVVIIDQKKLETTVRITWDVVTFNGKFHVFTK